MFSEEQIEALQAKLDPDHVKSRKQGNTSLSYIEGWHAIAEANRIFGFGNWDRETLEMKELGEPYQNDRGNWVVSYAAKVRISVRVRLSKERVDYPPEACRDGYGFGNGFAHNVGDAHESAIKEAETDAMKRALMTFGNPFGLALYDKKKANVGKEGGVKPQPDSMKEKGSHAMDWPKGWNKTKLQGEIRTLISDLGHMETPEQVEKLLDEYATVIELCEKHMPSWWNETDPERPEFEPLESRIERTRAMVADIQEAAADVSYEIPVNGNWINWLNKIDEKIDKAPDLDALTKLQMDNASNLASFSEINEADHKALMDHFTQRMGDLMQGPSE